MKQTVNLRDFREAFQAIRPDNFSYEGLEVLFNYLEEWEESTGDEIDLDVIGICCDFVESTIDDVFEDYDISMDGYDDERDAIYDYLCHQCAFVGWVNIPDNGWRIIYRAF